MRYFVMMLLVLASNFLTRSASTNSMRACVVMATDRLEIAPDENSGSSGAVRVQGVGLIHTEQVLSIDSAGRVRGNTTIEQLGAILDRLELADEGTTKALDRCVKLNLYVRNDVDAAEVRSAIAARFRGRNKPATCYVTTELPAPEARVAADAVIAAHDPTRKGVGIRNSDGTRPATALLPTGGRAYVSGQAESGDLATATRKTLESLQATLRFVDSDWSQVVQLKAFLTPMQEVEPVRREIQRFFGERTIPPLVYVQWFSSPTTPIEIELVTAVRNRSLPQDAPRIEYLTPPGMTASPIFSRVARLVSDDVVYVSGLVGTSDSAEQQVRDVFLRLEELLKPVGGNLQQLVKATYYVTDDEVSRQLNLLRPSFYDPRRPPAASKAVVSGVGVPGRTLAIDMIAIPGDTHKRP
ncbi:MAG: RidA family protein [Planctomycetes bacterium]|nr:RidA family protein [Planctomycetota bacterium]